MKPAMPGHTGSRLVACHECDLLIDLASEVDSDEVLSCPHYRHRLLSGHDAPLDSVVAFTSSALIVLIIANSFPFLAFQAQG